MSISWFLNNSTHLTCYQTQPTPPHPQTNNQIMITSSLNMCIKASLVKRACTCWRAYVCACVWVAGSLMHTCTRAYLCKFIRSPVHHCFINLTVNAPTSRLTCASLLYFTCCSGSVNWSLGTKQVWMPDTVTGSNHIKFNCFHFTLLCCCCVSAGRN